MWMSMKYSNNAMASTASSRKILKGGEEADLKEAIAPYPPPKETLA